MNHSPVIFDIETRPVSMKRLKEILPTYDLKKDKHYDTSITADANEAFHWDRKHERAALHAETASVCALGFFTNGIDWINTDRHMHESQLLREFWSWVAKDHQLIGFNVFRFDFPFLVRRSWYHGLETPGISPSVLSQVGFYPFKHVDLLKIWQCGNSDSWASLDVVCKAAGIDGKPSDCTGADFHRVLDESPDIARNYLANDLRMTEQLARRMRVL